jgi:competence protein ComFA
MAYCEVCGCTDIKYFGKRKGKLYCRRCISFKGENVIRKESKIEEKVKPMLKYKLTKDQLRVSNCVTYAIKNNKNVLIYAVCGAGKTEIVYDVISYMINKNKTVGFAIPRKDVVIELEDRIKDAFPNLKIVSVYGGHTKELNGDIMEMINDATPEEKQILSQKLTTLAEKIK